MVFYHHFSFYGAFFRRARFLLFLQPPDAGKGKKERVSPSRMPKAFFLTDADGEMV